MSPAVLAATGLLWARIRTAGIAFRRRSDLRADAARREDRDAARRVVAPPLASCEHCPGGYRTDRGRCRPVRPGLLGALLGDGWGCRRSAPAGCASHATDRASGRRPDRGGPVSVAATLLVSFHSSFPVESKPFRARSSAWIAPSLSAIPVGLLLALVWLRESARPDLESFLGHAV